jgi:hypothetical protein
MLLRLTWQPMQRAKNLTSRFQVIIDLCGVRKSFVDKYFGQAIRLDVSMLASALEPHNSPIKERTS